jgi:predicted RNase H-like nuclease (RuvC/YqgF family)
MANMAEDATSDGARHAIETEPDTPLPALDGEINRLELEIELLEARRRRADKTTEHKRIGRQIRTQQKKIVMLRSTTSRTGRVPAMLDGRPDDHGPLSSGGRPMNSALVAVEKNAE